VEKLNYIKGENEINSNQGGAANTKGRSSLL